MPDPSIRLILTNDIFGSFFPHSTSWGEHPGGDALVECVDAAREGATTAVWIDGGDFSGGGPLVPTDPHIAWDAARALGIDMVVPGNHEFDLGDEAFLAEIESSPFDVLAADLPWAERVAGHAVVSTPSGLSVLVIGISTFDRRGPRVYHRPADLSGSARRVREVASRFAGEVARTVVVIHDGVDWPTRQAAGSASVAAGAVDTSRIAGFCADVADVVDVVVGGHTLLRHVGTLGGVPYVQPWALAAELGIVDISPTEVRVGGVDVVGEPGWSGPGADEFDRLSRQVVGDLASPLVTDPSGTWTVGDAIAYRLVGLLGVDAALVSQIDVGCMQLAKDGITSHLDGRVTEADIRRALPWPAGEQGDTVSVAELGPEDLGRAVESLDGPMGPASVAWRDASRQYGSVAVSANYLPTVAAAIEADADWAPTGTGQRDALRAAVEHLS